MKRSTTGIWPNNEMPSNARDIECADAVCQSDIDKAIALSMETLSPQERRARELAKFQEERMLQTGQANSRLIKNKEDMRNKLLHSSHPVLLLEMLSIGDLVARICSFFPQIRDIVQLWRVFGDKPKKSVHAKYENTYVYAFLMNIAKCEATIRYKFTPCKMYPLARGLVRQKNPEPRLIPYISPVVSYQQMSIRHWTERQPAANPDERGIFDQIAYEYPFSQQLAEYGIQSNMTEIYCGVHGLFSYDLDMLDPLRQTLRENREDFFLKSGGRLYYKIRTFNGGEEHCRRLEALFRITNPQKTLNKTFMLICVANYKTLADMSAAYNILSHIDIIKQRYDLHLWRVHRCDKYPLEPLAPSCTQCALGGILIFPRGIQPFPVEIKMERWAFEIK